MIQSTISARNYIAKIAREAKLDFQAKDYEKGKICLDELIYIAKKFGDLKTLEQSEFIVLHFSNYIRSH